ncbi:hypothetical protein [Pseudoscardovia radai]|uniref:hypothetical protein n=1 Tax=Pseudoscardovia radai TaxID=987066 RepID=UPI003991EB04
MPTENDDEFETTRVYRARAAAVYATLVAMLRNNGYFRLLATDDTTMTVRCRANNGGAEFDAAVSDRGVRGTSVHITPVSGTGSGAPDDGTRDIEALFAGLLAVLREAHVIESARPSHAAIVDGLASDALESAAAVRSAAASQATVDLPPSLEPRKKHIRPVPVGAAGTGRGERPDGTSVREEGYGEPAGADRNDRESSGRASGGVGPRTLGLLKRRFANRRSASKDADHARGRRIVSGADEKADHIPTEPLVSGASAEEGAVVGSTSVLPHGSGAARPVVRTTPLPTDEPMGQPVDEPTDGASSAGPTVPPPVPSSSLSPSSDGAQTETLAEARMAEPRPAGSGAVPAWSDVIGPGGGPAPASRDVSGSEPDDGIGSDAGMDSAADTGAGTEADTSSRSPWTRLTGYFDAMDSPLPERNGAARTVNRWMDSLGIALGATPRGALAFACGAIVLLVYLVIAIATHSMPGVVAVLLSLPPVAGTALAGALAIHDLHREESRPELITGIVLTVALIVAIVFLAL